jgi:hypothetical protein
MLTKCTNESYPKIRTSSLSFYRGPGSEFQTTAPAVSEVGSTTREAGMSYKML